MTLEQFEEAFRAQGPDPRTGAVDRFDRQLLRQGVDVSFLRPALPAHQEYYRTFFQVSILQRRTGAEKLAFVEQHFDLLGDWWHVDGIVSFLGDSLDMPLALEKARAYVASPLPYVRRLGYVLFIPRLVRDPAAIGPLFALFKNDPEYHVIMAQAWLLSFLAMCDPDRTYAYLRDCDLSYAIVGRAIQKICDSFVVSDQDKARFKSLRPARRAIR